MEHKIKEDSGEKGIIDLGNYRKKEVWSQYLENNYGVLAAISFIIGSDILLDKLHQEMQELSSMPRGANVGELSNSWIASKLPPQFLMRYDYDFLHILQATIIHFREAASTGSQIIAHSVMEELALYLIMETSRLPMEDIELNLKKSDIESYGYWKSWAFDIFDDMDIVTYLYTDMLLDNSSQYHFEHWQDAQFYCDSVFMEL